MPGYGSGHSKQAPFPFSRELSVDTIALAGDKLWNELVGNSASLKVTNVQLAFTGIDATEIGQSSIENFLKPASSKKRSRESPEGNEHNIQDGTDSKTKLIDDSLESSYTCPRCGWATTFPNMAGLGDDDQQAIVLKTRVEHEDLHFAQDLAQESEGRTIIAVSPRAKPKPAKRRKPQPEPKGIEKFFRK